LATEGYSSEHFAPGYQESIFSGFLEYEAIHNSMITQSLMWKVYNEEFKEKQKGKELHINVCLFITILANYYKLLFSVVYMSTK